ncbi:MAG: hypothetical protein ABI682_06975 [Acidobacteriota bacterium]
MRRMLTAFLLGGLISAGGVAAADKTAGPENWKCSLTGKTVQACCCTQQKDGKLYCTLAKKTVETCCCKAVSAEKVARK